MRGRIEEAYDNYGAAVYRLAMAYLGRHAEAEDVTQEVFIKLIKKAPAFHDSEHEKRWLMRITANLCRDTLRSPRFTNTVALEEDYSMPDSDLFGEADAIVRLPEAYKGVIHLHYYEGYTVAEVAKILHLSTSAVKMRLKRGRELLKFELEEDEWTETNTVKR